MPCLSSSKKICSLLEAEEITVLLLLLGLVLQHPPAKQGFALVSFLFFFLETKFLKMSFFFSLNKKSLCISFFCETKSLIMFFFFFFLFLCRSSSPSIEQVMVSETCEVVGVD